MISAASINKLRQKWARYKTDPVLYVQEVTFGARPDAELEPYQCDVLNAISLHDRVAVCMANGMGKDMVSACALEWFLCNYEGARIPCTAPVERQIKDIFFAEVHKWVGKSLARGMLNLGSVSVSVNSDPKNWYALGFTAGDSDAEGGAGATREGFHADNLLYIMTESRGLSNEAWNAAKKACTGPNNKILAQGIPGAEAGEFYRIHSAGRSTWRCFVFPSARKDSAGQWEATSKRVSLASILEKSADGEDAPLFVNGVLSQFSKQGSNSLIPLDWVRAAMERKPDPLTEFSSPAEREYCYGVDPAHGEADGDNTTIAQRRGRNVAGLFVSKSDPYYCARQVYDLWKEHPGKVYVDGVGIGGGVIANLKALGVDVLSVNSGERATQPEKFMRMRDELWWNMRELLDPANGYNICLPDDPELATELSCVTFSTTVENKILVEPKKITRRRLGGRSTDRADCLCLAYWRRFRLPKTPPPVKPKKDPAYFLDKPNRMGAVIIDPISGYPL